MIYIVLALKSEAQAFVDKYKLQKSQLKNYSLFSSEKIKIIVSGIGVNSARFATQVLIDTYDIRDDDIYLNVGICAANSTFKIAQLVQIGSILYHEKLYEFEDTHLLLLSIDKESSVECAPLVDMEAYGFYDAVVHSPAIKKFYIFKVVSDHFEPHKITKEFTKKLIFNQIDAINKLINYKE